jgi:murein DD-endopeptidase MepM/ murein hydrolase activator NlpD
MTAHRSSRVVFAVAVSLATLAPASSSAAAMQPYLRPVRGAILRHYEPPPTPYAAGHRGIDMEAAAGTPVLAANDGVVAFAGPVGGRLFVSIDHADGIRTTYSFLSAILVKKGQIVNRGEQVAYSGTGDGSSPQPHLHFGARTGGDYIDPEPLLVDGLRRDLSQAIHLAPDEAA